MYQLIIQTMKLIAVTQRDIFIDETEEQRDSIDKRWYDFFNKIDLIPLLLPNNLILAVELLNCCNVAGILLTGGGEISVLNGHVANQLSEKSEPLIYKGSSSLKMVRNGDLRQSLNGSRKERERIEEYLIELSIKNKLPLLGVCRGMQKIQNYFGIKLQKVDGHVMDMQEIVVDGKKRVVNSYHKYGTTETNRYLSVLAKSYDGVVKAVNHQSYNISGIMWHPERCQPFENEDINFFKKFYASSDISGR
ncbi:MAG: hypothetical protein A2887_05475 [Alphaproteobacteria bacterium RIFCSPLOWO2_01_FULL_40_26]|nr:MAG: hypothetical protein A3D15_05930 [Alphaproteobacteria bacterium RIFCSPHIGHO2_02_FULL_40_34]OFW94182.1 MAG: hypothetical protein A2887_05475 [Alphaproteobacteria bacterium RIFCSPLOWO2_01_FULL_40_26]OFX09751.1 MAG: hypothetical protein A3H30_00235 [Alphaproteobacteria bacterium RIFCSPLOWO2_02_FULL_40_19]OFX11459.1 MAG: hypothetical protein A3G22_02100 [Alphaproteobacteria bacterium RIFCSPLOWO2_12_FULL_40_11]